MDTGKLQKWINRAQAGAVTIIIAVIAFGIFARFTWSTFFKYVDRGEMLVIISKTGDALPAGQILAEPGQKGIRKVVLGEGRHFVWPILYETEIKRCIDIAPGEIGIVRSKIGKDLGAGEILADEGDKGIRKRVLPPGRHRLNPYGYEVETRKATEIPPGYVGFVTSLAGVEAKGRFAEEGEKGVLRDVLPPGLYYLNPFEYDVQTVEIGVNQISFLENDNAQIKFPSEDGFEIDIDATVEWELHPKHVADVMIEFGDRTAIEEKVIRPQSKSISRLQGSTYGAKDFLLGEGREKFQRTFTQELSDICESKNITVHSAFIRRIVVPDTLLDPIKEAFVSVEKQKTARFWEDTKKSAELFLWD